jgi:hypothetical protein
MSGCKNHIIQFPIAGSDLMTNGFCKIRTWIHHGYYYTIETQVYQEIDRKEIMLLYREEMSIH